MVETKNNNEKEFPNSKNTVEYIIMGKGIKSKKRTATKLPTAILLF